MVTERASATKRAESVTEVGTDSCVYLHMQEAPQVAVTERVSQ